MIFTSSRTGVTFEASNNNNNNIHLSKPSLQSAMQYATGRRVQYYPKFSARANSIDPDQASRL